MKTYQIRNLVLLFWAVVIAYSCANQPKRTSESTTPEDQTSASTSPAPTITAPVKHKVPLLLIPAGRPDMQRALTLFTEYGNSDEFFDYVKVKVPKQLEGGNESDRDVAIIKTRECFSSLGPVDIRFRDYGVWPFYKSAAIGGWDGSKINQNPRITMTEVERAGHWIHELTHACHFTHISNNIKLYPIIRKSWSYQLGYAFEDFVIEKESRNLAAESL